MYTRDRCCSAGVIINYEITRFVPIIPSAQNSLLGGSGDQTVKFISLSALGHSISTVNGTTIPAAPSAGPEAAAQLAFFQGLPPLALPEKHVHPAQLDFRVIKPKEGVKLAHFADKKNTVTQMLVFLYPGRPPDRAAWDGVEASIRQTYVNLHNFTLRIDPQNDTNPTLSEFFSYLDSQYQTVQKVKKVFYGEALSDHQHSSPGTGMEKSGTEEEDVGPANAKAGTTVMKEAEGVKKNATETNETVNETRGVPNKTSTLSRSPPLTGSVGRNLSEAENDLVVVFGTNDENAIQHLGCEKLRINLEVEEGFAAVDFFDRFGCRWVFNLTRYSWRPTRLALNVTSIIQTSSPKRQGNRSIVAGNTSIAAGNTSSVNLTLKNSSLRKNNTSESLSAELSTSGSKNSIDSNHTKASDVPSKGYCFQLGGFDITTRPVGPHDWVVLLRSRAFSLSGLGQDQIANSTGAGATKDPNDIFNSTSQFEPLPKMVFFANIYAVTK